MTPLHVVVNGEDRQLEPGTTVALLVTALECGPAGVAVAVNAEVVPRSCWTTTELGEGDRVEVLTAMQGG